MTASTVRTRYDDANGLQQEKNYQEGRKEVFFLKKEAKTFAHASPAGELFAAGRIEWGQCQEGVMHNVYILPIFTILVVVGLGWWNLMSVKEHQRTGGNKQSGFGGPNDPMA